MLKNGLLIEEFEPTVVDLFAGAGGTGQGFKAAGYRILGAVELDENAAKTYTSNLGASVRIENIGTLDPEEYRRDLRLEKGELDVLVGCPPCQGFSRMRNGKGEDDLRNDLVLRYLEFVKALEPKFAVFENVPGITRTAYGKAFYKKLCEGLQTLGYEVEEYEVDAADYGVPQHRKRVIVIARQKGLQKPVLRATHCNPKSRNVKNGLLQPWLTVADAIGGGKFPMLAAGENGEQCGKYPNHVAPRTRQKVLDFIMKVPHDGGSRRDVPQSHWLDCHKSHDGHRDVYGRASWGQPANTITSGCTNPSKGRFVHPDQDRALTPREAAALQGFPENYAFYGDGVSSQIGNAVPPPLAKAIADALKTSLIEKMLFDTMRHVTGESCYDASVSMDAVTTAEVPIGETVEIGCVSSTNRSAGRQSALAS